MLITRDNQPVTIIRAGPPHLNSEGLWHGDFVLPDAPEAVLAQAGFMAAQPGQIQQSPHVKDWLGSTVSVEWDEHSVPAARIVAISGARCEWEGEADA